ncbi:ABC transporter ATP-binding protein [Undibacterium sp. 5I1]|uniref:ABC transporter ATP-binding protein n=1 Tax=unclassified Undibacterium TaxID=2630295 RepID=UPI002AB4A432|nr:MULTISPECIES: ABC transporter ATP-binding protein [unclassified Undibacterium]MDY7539470.1 ABC transporter ATP-binding protein [Undibacterium sp. 5I1]MEB0230729.1 ABC transporter ATP-binding protein [Undibacterium sp. 10I3]MEB0258792.1 ABC transporter ATP-binding protein [Undibacterium sp. 5I1]
MSPAIVDISNIHKYFGTQAVLQSTNWKITPGKVIGLLGRNGAGKSTLLECMLGLREIDQGEVRLFGESVSDLSTTTRAKIGYVPQKNDLFEWLTPLQMLDYFQALYPRWNTQKVKDLMERWGVNPVMQNKTIGKLSAGEKQRLSIIRALAHDPELLILDEPVSSLDPVGRREFLRELINGVIDQHTTVIFSTHILSDLERIALDVAFLKDGKISLQSPLDSLLETARRIIGSSADINQIKFAHEIRREQDRNGMVSVVIQTSEEEIAAISKSNANLRIETMNLEDLFVEVTK